jgi:hypothetical protein
MITDFEHGTGDERGTLAERRTEIEPGSLRERRPGIEHRTTALRVKSGGIATGRTIPMTRIRDHAHQKRAQDQASATGTSGPVEKTTPRATERTTP